MVVSGLLAAVGVVACGSTVRSGEANTTTPPAATPVTFAPGVNPGSAGLAGQIVHDQGGTLAPCTGTYEGNPAATYAPTVVSVDPTGRLRWAWCPAEPNGAWVSGEVDGAVLAQFWQRDAAFLVAFDAGSGEPRWWKTIDWDTPLSVDAQGVARIRGPDGSAILDPRTGGEQPEARPSTTALMERSFTDAGIVAVIDRDVDQHTGRTIHVRGIDSAEDRWTRDDVGTLTDVDLLTVDDGVLIVSRMVPPSTIGLDLRTGDDRWQLDAPLFPLLGGMGPDENQIVVGHVFLVQRSSGNRSEFEAHSTTDGQALWKTDHRPQTDGRRQTQGAASDVVVTEGDPTQAPQFEVRDATSGQVRGTGPGAPQAIGPDRIVTNQPPQLFDTHTGQHVADVAIPCLGDTSCSLTRSYVELVALHGDDIIFAVNDFSGG